MDELLDIVDENDNIIGQDTKRNKLEKELISRNVAIFIKDSTEKFVVAKRAPHKKVFPNLFDLAACGNVSAGESYEEAAGREIKEELGIECKLKLLTKKLNIHTENGRTLKYYSSIFLGSYDHKLTLNDELTEYTKIGLAELKSLMKKSPELFCPFFIEDFKEVEHIIS